MRLMRGDDSVMQDHDDEYDDDEDAEDEDLEGDKLLDSVVTYLNTVIFSGNYGF